MSMESPTGSAESSGAQRGPSASAGRLWTVQVARHRLFVAVDRNARHRRAGDVVVVVALTLLLVAAAMLDGHGDLVAKVVDMPPAVHLLAGAALAVAAAWSLFLVAAVVARLRTDLLARLGTGLVAAGLVGVPLLAHLGASNALVVLLACATAGGVLRAYVGRPYRKFGRWSIGVALALTWLVGGGDLVAAAVVVVAGELAVALVAILFGSSEGVPDARDVEHTLAKLGVEVGPLSVGAQRASGSFDLTGVDASGRIVCVRLIRRDAWGAQFVVRAWRSFWYPSAPSAGTSRFHQLEREALMVLLAEQGGVMVPEVVTVDRGPSDDALLVVRLPTGTSDLARGAQTLDDQMLDDQWRAVDRLHAAGIAHRDLGPDVWRTVEGHVLLADLGSAALSRSGDDQLLDQAQLLCTNVVQVGEERAVSAAVEHFGAEGLEKVLPYLQQAALGPDLRKASRSDALDLDQLRSVAASRAGVDVPTLAKLRRVSWSSLLSLGLLLLASFTVVSLISGIGAEQVIDEFAAANWWWFVPTLVVGQFAILAGAVPARGASPRRVAIGLLAALQMAIAFVALALPSTAARLAIILRFFERQGVPPASATTIAALDSFSGFVVQILILLAVELFGPGTVKLSLSLSLEQSGGGIGRLLALLAALLAVVVVAAVIVVALPSTRHRLQEWLRPKTREAVETLRGLRSVNRVLVLLGGNFAVQALNAITLQFAVLMFGSRIGFVPALVVFVVAALFGGLMPVPGGVGVVEAALAVGLTAVGLDAGVALAAAIAFRLATFYLPPIWGFGVFRWMQSQDYL